jgi:hypothetical protein
MDRWKRLEKLEKRADKVVDHLDLEFLNWLEQNPPPSANTDPNWNYNLWIEKTPRHLWNSYFKWYADFRGVVVYLQEHRHKRPERDF